ncbi:MAG: CAP domain-containing protein [Microbacteriaceae bacterium]|nr:CAP domain-containing protein [Microbacteriaceae bacterium]
MRRFLLGICFLLPFAAGSALAQDRAAIDAERDRLLARINAYRAENGAGPLRLSATLQRAAEGHSGDMASRDYFEHVTPEGRLPVDRATAAGYSSRFVGENLAAGHAGADATFTQWRNSPAHDRGMRDPRYHAVGLGYVARPGSRYRHYWTMLMGDRVDVPLGATGPATLPAPEADVPAPPTSAPPTAADDTMWPGADDTEVDEGECDGDDCADDGGCAAGDDECDDDADWQQDDQDGAAAPVGTPTMPAGWMMGPFGFPVPAIPGITIPAVTGTAPSAAPPATSAPATAAPAPAAPTGRRGRAPTVDLQQLFGLLQSMGVLGVPAP